MNTYLVNNLLNVARHRGIKFTEQHNGEVSFVCPKCTRIHKKVRETLYFRPSKDSWKCFRCNIAGSKKEKRNPIEKLLTQLEIPDLVPQFTNETLIDQYTVAPSLSDMKNKLLRINKTPPSIPRFMDLEEQLDRIEGYRIDFSNSRIGIAIRRYIVLTRLVHPKQIRKYRIGFATKGKYEGCAIFPIFMNGQCVAWQGRRVLFASEEDNKYINPTEEECGTDMRNVIFNYDNICERKDTPLVIMEGVFDVLCSKLNGIALLGKTISDEQIAKLAEKNVRYIDVLLDYDAIKDAKKLASIIKSKLWTVRRVRVLQLPIKTDPADYFTIRNGKLSDLHIHYM